MANKHTTEGNGHLTFRGLRRSGFGAWSGAFSNSVPGFVSNSELGRAGWFWVSVVFLGVGLMRWTALNWHPVGLHFDEAQYWLWSLQLDWGFYSKPPGIAALIAGSTALFGDGTNGVRALAMACWLLSAALLIKLGECLHSRRAGLWACALFSVTPAANLLGLVATTDAPLMLGWTTTMALTWWAFQSPSRRQRAWLRWVLLGLAWGLTLNAKYTAAALAPSLFLAAWFSGRPCADRQPWSPWPGLGVVVLVAGACLLPNLMWNAQHDWPTLQHTLDITWRAKDAARSEAMASPVLRLVYFAGGLLLLCGPAFLAVAVVRVSALLRSNSKTQATHATHTTYAAWAALFVWPLFAVGTLQSLLGGMQVNWLAPVLPGLCLMAALALVKTSTPRWGIWGVSITMMGSVALSLWVASSTDIRLRSANTPASSKPLDFWHKTRHWPLVLRDLEPWVAGQAKPIWTSERDVFVQSAYAWRHLSPALRSYTASGRVRHHFDLFYPTQTEAGEVMWLDRSPPPLFKGHAYTPRHLFTSEHGGLRLELWLLTPLTHGGL